MTKKHYMLIKNRNLEGTVIIDYSKIDGFVFKPKNNIEYDGITVNKLVLIKPSFTEKLLRKKTKRKLEAYLSFLISIINSDEDNDKPIREVLDDVARYKYLVKGIYFKYLDDKYYHLLLKKFDLLEEELKKKQMIIQNRKLFENEKAGKSR